MLDKYGVWANGGIAAHCVYLSGGDAELFAKRGVTAVHNPVSNLKLMSGVAPLFFLRECGMSLALGTDGVASNNSHNLFEEMKVAALVQNYSFGEDHGQLSAADILAMATVNGAKALGRDTGVIAPGKTADLILVDLDAPQPDPLPRRGGKPGVLRPRLQRVDEYGPGERHIPERDVPDPGPGEDPRRGQAVRPAAALQVMGKV